MSTTNFTLHKWIRLTLLSLLIVSSLGIILRYKIAFSLPFIHQKHLLHAHSHFAFTGWISQALMILMVGYLTKVTSTNFFKQFNKILATNLIVAYAMLISFALEGYGAISITLSTSSILIACWFAVAYVKALNKLPTKSVVHTCFKAALFFNIFSSFGAFALAIFMATKIMHANWYLAAEYYYLHFQYNGWFSIAGLGLLLSILDQTIINKFKNNILILVAAVIPTYFLSTLWMKMPMWLYGVIVLASLAQLFIWVKILLQFIPMIKMDTRLTSVGKKILLLSAIACSIKILLQAGSVIPELSKLAFGYRPIVIGYLHLVLLGVITLFILGYLFSLSLIKINKKAIIGLVVFTIGIVLNELSLMLQGVSAIIGNNAIPFMNEILLAVACIMFSGLLLLNIAQSNKNDLAHSS